MGITRLQLYNGALLLCGERSLASLSEEREPRRLLDEVYNSNGIDYCLERGQWWFAMRTVRIDNDTSQTPDFGYPYVFSMPDDWIATSAVCQDEYFGVPLIHHAAEPDYWFAAITPIFVKYVSNDAAYGGDLARWPGTFSDFACAYFATRIISKLAGSKAEQREMLFGTNGNNGYLQQTLHTAKNAAAKTQPTQVLAQGRWTKARSGSRWRRGPFGDGGTTGNLTG